MLTLEKFSGINNVVPQERLDTTDLTVATNVDIGLTGEVWRRGGYSVAADGCHKNVHQGVGFMLATVEGALVGIAPDGTTTVLHPALGSARVWYCNLPDGRTAFSNGLIRGLTDGKVATEWGVPEPESAGAVSPVAGALHPGEYRYVLTYVRLLDGLEGAGLWSAPVQLSQGGLLLMNLPQRDGYKINVYLTGANGTSAHLAGSTPTNSFSYLGANDALVTPYATDGLVPAPAGICLAFWRGRALIAVGKTLCASRPHHWESFDPRKDFKQFSSDITLVEPVKSGIYVGTGTELAFLGGADFDSLVYDKVMDGRVVKGSGVSVSGDQVKAGDGAGAGRAMICIAGGEIVAGFDGGNLSHLSANRYTTDVREVAATFRKVNGIPQYIAVAQQ